MKSFTGKFSSARGWALLLALLLGAGMMISACGEEETPAPTTPAPPPPPPPAPEPTPEPEPTGPATPGNLRVTATTSSSITWTWDAVEGALGYVGQFSPDSAFTDADQTFGPIVAPQTSYTVENLSGNMTGYFRVRSGTGTSLTDLTLSDWSDGVSGSTAAPPTPPPATALSAPTGLSVTDRGDNDIALEWNSVRDADHYQVEQRASGGAWTDASCGGNDNEVDSAACEATGLDEATSYTFRVRAVPASDDDTLTVSEWTELDDAVSTTGTPPRTTVTGGDDDLNVIWESEVRDVNGTATHFITWIWDQVADRESEYQLYFHKLADTSSVDTSDEDPCPKPTAPGMWGTNTFNTRIEVPNTGTDALLPASPTTTLAAGDVALLCVQTTWLDDREVRQYGNLSWAWAATKVKQGTASGTNPAAEEDNDERVTSRLNWFVELDKGFDYEVRVLSASVKDGGLSAAAECADGRAGTDLTSTADDVVVPYTVRNPTKYTTYDLCVRPANDAGEAEWQKMSAFGDGTELMTLPGAPPRPTYQSSEARITTTGTGNSATHDVRKLVWTVAERSDQPREGSDTNYDATIIDRATALPTADVQTECANTSDATIFDLSGTGLSTTSSGIRITWEDTSSNLLTITGDRYIYACIRSELEVTSGTAAGGRATGAVAKGPWAISGATRLRAP